MTVFGHPVLFDCLEKKEDTASSKTPMQWHKTRSLSLENAIGQRRHRRVERLSKYLHSFAESSHKVDENQVVFRNGPDREWQIVIDAVRMH